MTVPSKRPGRTGSSRKEVLSRFLAGARWTVGDDRAHRQLVSRVVGAHVQGDAGSGGRRDPGDLVPQQRVAERPGAQRQVGDLQLAGGIRVGGDQRAPVDAPCGVLRDVTRSGRPVHAAGRQLSLLVPSFAHQLDDDPLVSRQALERLGGEGIEVRGGLVGELLDPVLRAVRQVAGVHPQVVPEELEVLVGFDVLVTAVDQEVVDELGDIDPVADILDAVALVGDGQRVSGLER